MCVALIDIYLKSNDCYSVVGISDSLLSSWPECPFAAAKSGSWLLQRWSFYAFHSYPLSFSLGELYIYLWSRVLTELQVACVVGWIKEDLFGSLVHLVSFLCRLHYRLLSDSLPSSTMSVALTVTVCSIAKTA